MRGLEGKVAIVTGGAGRIGIAVVRRLVEEGVRVVVADINEEAAVAVAAEHGDNAIAITFDSADAASIEQMVAHSVAHFGRLDILHNNAAYVALGKMGSDLDALGTSIDLWEKTMKINVDGYFLACRFALPHLIAGGGGSIINMSSGSGLVGDYCRIAYGTSKGAVATLTKYVAAQHGKQKVRCNAISPGMHADDKLRALVPKLVELNEKHSMLPWIGHPDDIASLVAFLGSDESRNISGQNIVIDGGSLAHNTSMMDAIELDSLYS